MFFVDEMTSALGCPRCMFSWSRLVRVVVKRYSIPDDSAANGFLMMLTPIGLVNANDLVVSVASVGSYHVATTK